MAEKNGLEVVPGFALLVSSVVADRFFWGEYLIPGTAQFPMSSLLPVSQGSR